MHQLGFIFAIPLFAVAAILWSWAGPAQLDEFRVEGREAKVHFARWLLPGGLLLVARCVREEVALRSRRLSHPLRCMRRETATRA